MGLLAPPFFGLAPPKVGGPNQKVGGPKKNFSALRADYFLGPPTFKNVALPLGSATPVL